jgi:cysteine desulfurase/selenocysteine lyase
MSSTVEAVPPFSIAAREEELPVLRDYTYLNAAFHGPMPVSAVRALNRKVEELQYPGIVRDGLAEEYGSALHAAERGVRERIARRIGAKPEEIVLTSNTSQGMNVCAQGIDYRPGDNVVIPADEFPSLTAIWRSLRHKGVEVRIVPFSGAGATVEAIMAHVDDRTRAVACSAITWSTGWRADLEALGARCAERGVLLIVDGIQAVGVQDLDVKALRVSALAFHGYKWLMAGYGLGGLYVAPEALDRIKPTFVSEAAIVNDDADEAAPQWQAGAVRYSLSNRDQPAFAALSASLDLQESFGAREIATRSTALAEQLYSGLGARPGLRIVSSDDPARRSAIIVFTTGSADGDAALVTSLARQKIMVSLRPLGVRVSPHFYNTEGDITRLLDALPR